MMASNRDMNPSTRPLACGSLFVLQMIGEFHVALAAYRPVAQGYRHGGPPSHHFVGEGSGIAPDASSPSWPKVCAK